LNRAPHEAGAGSAAHRDRLEENDGEFADDDPILEWPTDTKSLAQMTIDYLRSFQPWAIDPALEIALSSPKWDSTSRPGVTE
jgi:hypothetical protein